MSAIDTLTEEQRANARGVIADAAMACLAMTRAFKALNAAEASTNAWSRQRREAKRAYDKARNDALFAGQALETVLPKVPS